ncbi:DUF7331 family protein [Natronobacterium texcoconense]|uniref:Uncharacterized protein n=1 Tax=Natronobacterium texcoconense TaxID=1095778 RepID=A0A1H0ZPG5_NATTX|nr:hypothetical protein [Natronobacterium texcoconense]SDQ29405.1 hypothetical protein SAMN04489842_0381 [Natronobacterium texcoconense]
MKTEQDNRPREQPRVEFDQYVSYEDEDGLVICDRRNASAWVRCQSSALEPCRR